MDRELLLPWLTFAMVSSLALVIALVWTGRRGRLDARLHELSGKKGSVPEIDSVAELARQALPRVGAPLMPKEQGERTRLQARLVQAGFYSRQALVVFLGVKMLLMAIPVLAGFVAALSGLVELQVGLVVGGLLGIAGLIGPSFWLDQRKAARQSSLRRALPDALDVLVICLEGGLSLFASFRRISAELATAHPLLASELTIVEREIQLGRSTGEALRAFGERADLEEIRRLASVIIQAERFGASLVKTLRLHAETLRLQRMQRAEELAQKAAVRILFPTLLFIFPGLFIILLGPGLIQLLDAFAELKR
ncbi:MAG TPA: type II secretion system F family protein [Gemmataceae bacterium]|nr:type II secretion system F family protein [Gemmataceae bacterium]